VRRIKDGQITTVAGTGQPEFTGDGGPATQAALYWPTALEFDEDGSLLIADTRNHAVRRLLTDGSIETVAGTGLEGSSGDGGSAAEAQLDQPNGLAFAPDGSLMIADRGNFKIRRVTRDGRIDTVAGTGTKGYAGDGADALHADLGFIARIARDGDALLIADQSNSVVRRWTFPRDLDSP
jgi:sugar lactone lactonase YvrE